jgi:hypothetical protein
VRFRPPSPDASAGYAESPVVISTPGVRLAMVAVMFVASVAPVLTSRTLSEAFSPGST